MKDRVWQVGLVGTLDVDNYGDQLFPLIAEAELEDRLGQVQLHRFSYHAKTAAAWPYEVTSVTELPRLAASLDGLLVGGGFLVRFDKEVARGSTMWPPGDTTPLHRYEPASLDAEAERPARPWVRRHRR